MDVIQIDIRILITLLAATFGIAWKLAKYHAKFLKFSKKILMLYLKDWFNNHYLREKESNINKLEISDDIQKSVNSKKGKRNNL